MIRFLTVCNICGDERIKPARNSSPSKTEESKWLSFDVADRSDRDAENEDIQVDICPSCIGRLSSELSKTGLVKLCPTPKKGGYKSPLNDFNEEETE